MAMLRDAAESIARHGRDRGGFDTKDPWGRECCVMETEVWVVVGSCWEDGQWGTGDDLLVIVRKK
jgi:hypothetical protein